MRHRKPPVIAWSALVAVLAVAGAVGMPGQASATTPPQPVAPTAARSTSVVLASNVDCTLARTDMGLDTGRWTTEPPLVIGPKGRGQWGSESNMIWTGTEGSATYRTEGCADPTRNCKTVRVHWKNPYLAKNDYDANGTDPMFGVTWNGNGGNQAYVVFTLDNAS